MILVNTSLANLERIERGVASLFVPDLRLARSSRLLTRTRRSTARLRALLDGILSGHVTPDAGLRAAQRDDARGSGEPARPARRTRPVARFALIGATTGENGARRFEYRLDYGGPTLLIDFGLSSSGQVTTIAATYD